MAKKLPKLPELKFNLIYLGDGSRGWATRAFYCEEHPEIEVRVHRHPTQGTFRQVFLVDDDDLINYETIKKAWRTLIARPPRKKKRVRKSKLRQAIESTRTVDADREFNEAQGNVSKKSGRRGSRKRR